MSRGMAQEGPLCRLSNALRCDLERLAFNGPAAGGFNDSAVLYLMMQQFQHLWVLMIK